MKIGIDVDGVLTDLESYQLKYGKKYFKNVKDINESGYDICDIFHCDKEKASSFWAKYIWSYCLNEPIRDGAKELIDKLRTDGDKIYIITGRAHTTEDNARGKLFRKMLIYWLKKNDIKYDDIYYCLEDNSSKEKYEVCKKLGIDIMIEDKVENINSIKEISKVICIKNKNNIDIKDEDNIKVVSGFTKEVGDFIGTVKQSIVKDNDLEYDAFDKDSYKFSYGVVRSIGSPLFKALLHPTIINKESIPKEGPLLLCGNHLHVWDQFPVICSTNRVTHWMSKKEYFDSKMGTFFKKTGAICVDRENNPHEATLVATNYLNIGSAVGLFPEGTRNHLKQRDINKLYSVLESKELSDEEFINMLKAQGPLLSQAKILYNMYINGEITNLDYRCALNNIDKFLREQLPEEEYFDSLLLPFKYGAVSMAQKTNATIVPFGVTGDYKIGNDNLMVTFGDAYKISANSNLEDENSKLRSKVLELVKSNKRG